jgi:hypothetical protein
MLSSIYNFIGINNQETENPEETKEISKEAWVLLNNSDISGVLVHFDENDHNSPQPDLNPNQLKRRQNWQNKLSKAKRSSYKNKVPHKSKLYHKKVKKEVNRMNNSENSEKQILSNLHSSTELSARLKTRINLFEANTTSDGEKKLVKRQGKIVRNGPIKCFKKCNKPYVVCKSIQQPACRGSF